MHHRLRTAALVALLAVSVTACSKGGGSDDPDSQGARARAVSILRDSGLPADQAECIVDRIGADTVVEAPDAATLADGGPYQDAAKACTK